MVRGVVAPRTRRNDGLPGLSGREGRRHSEVDLRHGIRQPLSGGSVRGLMATENETRLIRGKVHRDSLERERTTLHGRAAILEQKLDRFGYELSDALDAIRRKDAGAFLCVSYPRADDIGNALAELNATKTRIGIIDQQLRWGPTSTR